MLQGCRHSWKMVRVLLRLPVDQLIGRPEDEQPVQKSDYMHKTCSTGWKRCMTTVHVYARQHLKVKSDKMKSRYDLQATGDEIKEGDAVYMAVQSATEERCQSQAQPTTERPICGY